MKLFAAILALIAAAPCAPLGAQQGDVIQSLDTSEPITFYIAEGEPDSEYRGGDRELALWALRAWERSAGGALEFVPAAEDEALIRVYFVPAGFGQYGEMRPLLLEGRRGAAVYIRPDTNA